MLLAGFLCACGGGGVKPSVRSEPATKETVQQSAKPARQSFEQVAAQACKMAGGECLGGGALESGNVLVAGINCRPQRPGLFCVRRGGPCEGHLDQRCCEKNELTGKFVAHGLVGCDRGYPVCLNVGDWRASSPATCTTPLPATAPADAPSLWAGAADVQAAARWACEQVGGRQIEREELAAVERGEEALDCDGYFVSFADFALCCIPKAACPAADKSVVCCKPDGTLDSKTCEDGKAVCNARALEAGGVRETKPGGCEPF